MKSHDLGCGSGAGGDNKDVLNVSVVMLISESSIYIWSRNFSHSSYDKKDFDAQKGRKQFLYHFST